MYKKRFRIQHNVCFGGPKKSSAKLSHCKALALPSTRKAALKMIDRNACLIAGVINGLLISILKAAEG